MRFLRALFMVLVLPVCSFAEKTEQGFVSINLDAPLIPGNAMSKLAELIRTHPEEQLVRDFPMKLAQRQFIVMFKDGPVPGSGNLHQGMSVRIRRDLRSSDHKDGPSVLALTIWSSFILDDALDDRFKHSALRHEWEHLIQRWRYGPPTWMSPAEIQCPPDSWTREVMLQLYRDELAAHLADLTMNKKLGWDFSPKEPFRSYARGGELALREWLAEVLARKQEYAPFSELFRSLALDGILVPFQK